jgi:hypothetical protein
LGGEVRGQVGDLRVLHPVGREEGSEVLVRDAEPGHLEPFTVGQPSAVGAGERRVGREVPDQTGEAAKSDSVGWSSEAGAAEVDAVEPLEVGLEGAPVLFEGADEAKASPVSIP